MAAAEYLGLRDLVTRFGYTRQGVYKLMKLADFPAPAFTINGGRTKVWRRVDLAPFELAHPEVTEEGLKRRKQIGFWRAIGKGDGSAADADED